MKKKSPPRKKSESPAKAPPRLGAAIILAGIGVLIGAAVLGLLSKKEPHEETAIYKPKPAGAVTFSKDIAPILFQNCSVCHQPGRSGPFSLLAYADAKKRAADIANVTGKRIMPPWLPEPGHGKFLAERRLTVEQIGLIEQWAREGAPEGNPADLPAAPASTGDWILGKPDLIVQMPEPYQLAAEGRDIYRNFVMPVFVNGPKFVRAVEVRPGNPKVVHHAFVKVDRTAQSRTLDRNDAEPGFPGMNAPAEVPDGHFLGWQPGRLPIEAPAGLAWRLDPGNDLVFQAHLNPSGKPETLQASLGLYFTDKAPTNRCFRMTLTSYKIDIPAGERAYVVEDNLKLPVDLQIIGVLPHAHYLAHEMHGWATLPTGEQKELLLIKQWDFNWQGDYRYAEPVFLPSGTILSMRFTYDNSTNNARNPNHPPKPVAYGPQSSDEMAELWFQVLPKNSADLKLLDEAYQNKLRINILDADLYALRKNPSDVKAHLEMGQVLFQMNKLKEAESHFLAAIQLQPDSAAGFYHLGLVFRVRNQQAQARGAFMEAIRLDPKDSRSFGNLGYVYLSLGDARASEDSFQQALRLDPADELAREGLETARQALR